MENNAELVRLEQFVDTLLTKYNDLKKRYLALEGTVQQRDTECANLKDQVAELRSERSSVSDRVSGLIGRIEQWETAQEDGLEPVDGDSTDMQGTLFSEKTKAAQ